MRHTSGVACDEKQQPSVQTYGAERDITPQLSPLHWRLLAEPCFTSDQNRSATCSHNILRSQPVTIPSLAAAAVRAATSTTTAEVAAAGRVVTAEQSQSRSNRGIYRYRGAGSTSSSCRYIAAHAAAAQHGFNGCIRNQQMVPAVQLQQLHRCRLCAS
jgi:hypothetical protein